MTKNAVHEITVKTESGKVFPARVIGHKERFATVVWLEESANSRCEASWETVIRCCENQRPLLV